MKCGEVDVFWLGCCVYYVILLGMMVGWIKYLLIMGVMLEYFCQVGFDLLFYYIVCMGCLFVFCGWYLFFGGVMMLMLIVEVKLFFVYGGDFSGIMVLNLLLWVEKYFYELGVWIV